MRQRTPLASRWEHPDRKSVSLAPSTLIQRILESPGAFEEMLANQQGKVLSEVEHTANHVSSRHLTPIATKPRGGGGREGTLHGDIAAFSCLFGLHTIEVTTSDGRKEEVAVGHSILAGVGGVGAGARPKAVPCRLASLQWHYTSEDDTTSEEGRAVAEIKRFLTAREAKLDKRWHETGFPQHTQDEGVGSQQPGLLDRRQRDRGAHGRRA